MQIIIFERHCFEYVIEMWIVTQWSSNLTVNQLIHLIGNFFSEIVADIFSCFRAFIVNWNAVLYYVMWVIHIKIMVHFRGSVALIKGTAETKIKPNNTKWLPMLQMSLRLDVYWDLMDRLYLIPTIGNLYRKQSSLNNKVAWCL